LEFEFGFVSEWTNHNALENSIVLYAAFQSFALALSESYWTGCDVADGDVFKSVWRFTHFPLSPF